MFFHKINYSTFSILMQKYEINLDVDIWKKYTKHVLKEKGRKTQLYNMHVKVINNILSNISNKCRVDINYSISINNAEEIIFAIAKWNHEVLKLFFYNNMKLLGDAEKKELNKSTIKVCLQYIDNLKKYFENTEINDKNDIIYELNLAKRSLRRYYE